ncbi:KaiC domain-containing protein [Halorubrum sp. N11]|uniref:KaiC domain-containing protein n=1 Tax=Halorubrum sp. N11 TaxID=3402276 RepID=UPI003EBEED8D
MSEEDDWFERALRDTDADSGATGDEEDGDATGADAETGDTDEDEDAGGGSRDSDRGDEPEDERESDPFGGIRDGERDPSPDVSAVLGGDDTDGGDFDGGDFDSGVFGSEQSRDDEPEPRMPEDDGLSDDETGDSDPFGGGSSGGNDPFGGGSFGGDDPFGGGSFGGDDPFGGGGGSGGGGGGGESSDSGQAGTESAGGGSVDPFGGYRDSAGGPGGPEDVDFGGFGDGGGGDASSEFDVDPDEFESSIERTDIGIEGLDEMILGGVPRRSLLSVIGGAGTGKTTFALQFLNEALESDRKGIYITLEQTRESILSTAEEKGWSFREHAEADRLAVVAIDPIEMANSLASIRNDLTRLIAEFDADRLVLDSVSLLEMMYDHPAKRRSEVFGFTRSLKNAGVTTLLTSEASEENPYASRHGIVEYLTDAVFVLQYIRGSDFRETQLAVEIQKIRDANHSRQSKPYDITDTGISVYGQANIF